MAMTPTVVLVNGAFADGASWSPLAMRLQGSGMRVRVPAIANRSLAEDAAYVRSFIEHIDGPVLLVGQSYGATVAAVAGDGPNVRGIVFIAGFILDRGESAEELARPFPPTRAVDHFEFATYPAVDGTERTEVSIAIDVFPYLAAFGIPADEAAVLAVTQRPLAAAIPFEQAASEAWSSRPTWGIVASLDEVINPDVVRFAFTRAGVREVYELPGPHLVTHTHPADVARIILDAARVVL